MSSRATGLRGASSCVVGIGIALTVVLPAPSLSAAAESTAPTVQREAWAWIAQRDGTLPFGAASGIRDDQLPVAWAEGDEKVTFLDLAPQPDPDSRLTVTLAVDDSGNNYALGDAELVICAVTEPWETGSPMAWDRQPARECDGASAGVYQPATNDFFFDLSELLAVLARTGGHGLVVTPDPATTVPAFQVVFRSAVEGGAQIGYRAAPGAGDPTSGDSAPSLAPHREDAGPPMDLAPSSQAATSEPPYGAPARGSTSETEAAAPATASAAADDVTSRLARNERQASLVGVYVGMGALAMLLTARRAMPAASGLLHAGISHDLTGANSRSRRGRSE